MMKLGMFMMPLHPPEQQPPWRRWREDREAILLADRLGYVEGFVGEHVTDHRGERSPRSLMFLASPGA